MAGLVPSYRVTFSTVQGVVYRIVYTLSLLYISHLSFAGVTSESDNMAAVFTLGSLLGLVLLVAIVAVIILGLICLCVCRRKQKSKDTSEIYVYA